MPKGEYLGEFEQLVLMAVLRLREEAYGMTVRREIETRAGREVSVGAVYATLERMEAKGLVRSFDGDASAERGGRPKRCFRVTPAGEESLRESLAALQRMAAGLKLVPKVG